MLKVGDVGTVNGPCTNSSLSEPHMRVHRAFPNCSNINLRVSSLKHAPIVGGFAKGDRVVSTAGHHQVDE